MQDLVPEIRKLAEELLNREWKMATAESCTGGLIGFRLTNEPGSSQWYQGGVVAYSNDMKRRLLGVDPEILDSCGAVSSECVLSMARGAASLTRVQVTVSVSGIAGPGGGTWEKPVGLVYLGWCVQGEVFWEKNLFSGDRSQVRTQAAARAIRGLVEFWGI